MNFEINVKLNSHKFLSFVKFQKTVRKHELLFIWFITVERKVNIQIQ